MPALRSLATATTAPVLYRKYGSVAVVSLNRPHKLNAYNVAMRDSLYEILRAIRDDPETRVMVLRGNGTSFSTGGDLNEFGSAPSPIAGRAARWRRDVWGVLRSLPQLTIAAVHGNVVGGGFEMALLCDLCIAATDARFALPETATAMIPGVGGTQTASRQLGSGWTLDLVLTGTSLPAHEAQRLGIVSRIVATTALRRTALDLVRRYSRLPPVLVAALKRAVGDGLDLPLPAGLALEARLNQQLKPAQGEGIHR